MLSTTISHHSSFISSIYRGKFPLLLASLVVMALFLAGCNEGGSVNVSPNTITLKTRFLMQDVSVLFPIPTRLPNSNAIHPSDVSNQGAYLPAPLLQNLPLLEPHLSTSTQSSQLELVGVRFDPPEIRLVWQIYKTVVNVDGQTQVVAFDTAVHSFYTISDQAGFMTDLKILSSLSRGDANVNTPLGIHPTLAQKGWSSSYATQLKSMLAKWCGEQSLFRMTFMAATGEHLRWEFGGFAYDHGRITTFQIPKINLAGIQKFINSSPSAGEFKGGIDIVPNGQNELNALITDSSSTSATTNDRLERAHFTSVTLENPTLSPTDQTDCASCHVAQMGKLWIESRAAGMSSETQNLFQSGVYNLKNTTPDSNRSDNLRSFGWFAGTFAISQRTINESALVADRLSQ